MPVLTPRLVRVLGVTAAAAVVLAVVATFAFSNQGGGPDRTASAEASPTTSAQPADAANTADAGTAGAGTAPGDTGTESSNTRPTTAPPTGPWIVYFKVIKKPRCASQDDNVLVIGWKVTGATSVALSVDNPELVGGYRSGYKLEDTETFNLSCAKGQTEKHTYTINTVGGGPSRRAQFQVTVTPPTAPTPTPTPSAAP